MASFAHDAVVAAIPSGCSAAAAWWASRSHRGMRLLRRDVGKTDDGRTVMEELAELRADVATVGRLFGEHLRDHHDFIEGDLPTPLQSRPPRRWRR